MPAMANEKCQMRYGKFLYEPHRDHRNSWYCQLRFTIHHLPSVVDSAFVLTRTAPAPCSRIFTDSHPRRARHASNRRIILVVQWVVRHVMLCYVVPDITCRPFGEWIDLDETEPLVPLDDANACSLRRLVATHGCYPGSHSI